MKMTPYSPEVPWSAEGGVRYFRGLRAGLAVVATTGALLAAGCEPQARNADRHGKAPFTEMSAAASDDAAPAHPETLPFEDDAGAVSVLIFTRTDCPVANRYAPEIRRLYTDYASKGVRFYLVFPDPRENQESMQAYLDEYALPCQGVLDPQHRLVRAAGVTVTPEAVVYNGSGALAYRGRIDDRVLDFGRSRPVPNSRDLENALTACLEHRLPEKHAAPAIGCLISDLRP